MALIYQGSYKAAMLLLVALIFLQASGPALGSNGKTCYSRQHRDAIVNVRVAVEHNGAITSSRVKQAEKDCILACCSEEVEPGIKCNMVVYKPSSQAGIDNCYLFHCETEQDCPLVPAKPGINTYDISKDVIHPTAKGNGRTTVMPIIRATPAKQAIATQTTTTVRPTTTTTPRIMQPSTTTTTQPTTTTSTTQPTTTTTTTTLPTTTTTQATTTSTTTTKHPPTEPAIVLVTMPVVTMPSSPPTTTTTTTTTTTQLTSTTTKVASTTSPTTTITTTRPPQPPKPPQPPVRPIRPPKKPFKPQKRPEHQAGKSGKVPTTKPTTTTTTTQKPTTTRPTTTPTTTTTTTTPTTTTTTTTTTTSTTTTTTTSAATTERTTIVVVEMENDLKDETSGPDTLLPPAVGSGLDKAKGSRMTWRNSLVAIVVVTLICLTLVLAIVGRKAMESFDRRHYTRLELNDLHYEI